MENKKLLVFLMTVLSLLLVVSTISATNWVESSMGKIENVEIDGTHVEPGNSETILITAGESIEVRVEFVSYVNDSVKIEVELEGDESDLDMEADTNKFNVEDGSKVTKKLLLKVPYDLEDQLSDDATLTVTVKGDDDVVGVYNLRVKREDYKVDVKSVSVDQNAVAGQTIPVDVVLENSGYENLDDVFVTVRIPALNVQKTGYFDDIVALECDEDSDSVENYGVNLTRKCNEDDEDTIYGRVYLTIPYEATTGVYNMEIVVENDDLKSVQSMQIAVQNEFSNGNIIVSSTSKTVAVGQEASYDLLIVNPTNTLKVYRIVTESSGSLSSATRETVVAVPAGSSETVTVSAVASKAGEQTFNVNVFSGEQLVKTVSLTANVTEGRISASNPVVILTVVLAIIFIVLLVVLIVLISKRPEKSEEFGESYY